MLWSTPLYLWLVENPWSDFLRATTYMKTSIANAQEILSGGLQKRPSKGQVERCNVILASILTFALGEKHNEKSHVLLLTSE